MNQLARHRARALPQSTGKPSRPRRGPAEQMLWPRDLDVVKWLAEQYSGRLDHLELLLGCGERQAQRVVARLRAHKLVDTRRVFHGQPPWVTPTGLGLRVSGSEFRPWAPNVGVLNHVAAVNDVRLHVQSRAPSSAWISERELAREQGVRAHLPDGLVEIDGKLVAIEVELTQKSQKRTVQIVDGLCQRYDNVLYFAAPAPRKRLIELAASGRWPGLGVRELPTIPGEPS